jgi:hypothetical protein
MMADTGYGSNYSGYGSTPRGKQTGSPNTKSIGASAKKFANTLNPWGFNIPKGQVPKAVSSAGGSNMKQPIPDPQLRGMDYDGSDPLAWPVVPNWDGSYTRQPSISGITPTVIAHHNQQVEHAYTRDGYQSSP